MYTPFSLLSYRTAYLIFIAFNLSLLLAALFILRPAISTADVPWLKSAPWLMFFLFLPLLISVAHGQDSILLLLLCSVVWQQLQCGKDWSAGLFLALSLFKFKIALPIAVLIAVRRGWRFSAGFLVASTGVTLISVGLVGRPGTADYFSLLYRSSSAVDRSAFAQQTLSVFPLAMPNLTGLLNACGARFLHSPIVFDVLVSACGLCIFVW